MPYMIRMSAERLNCVTLLLSNSLFIYVLKLHSHDLCFYKCHSILISKKKGPEKYEELNKAVHKWFLILRSENVPISGPMLKEKALEFAGGLNIEGFPGSEGWLEKWKKR